MSEQKQRKTFIILEWETIVGDMSQPRTRFNLLIGNSQENLYDVENYVFKNSMRTNSTRRQNM